MPCECVLLECVERTLHASALAPYDPEPGNEVLHAIIPRPPPLDQRVEALPHRRVIKRNNQAITKIDPFKFESLIRDCLRNRYPESEVTLTGGRKDLGVDIYIAKNNDNSILVQVKRQSNIDRSESVNTVRALNGVLVREGIPHGAVITTVRHFSDEAVRETEMKAKPGSDFDRYSMNLIAYDEVIEMIKSLKNDKAPFAGHMQAPSLEAWVERYYEPK